MQAVSVEVVGDPVGNVKFSCVVHILFVIDVKIILFIQTRTPGCWTQVVANRKDDMTGTDEYHP